jgi:hypothetical protein
MQRTQIILEDWQVQALRSRADRERKSVSALVREAVEAFLGRNRPESMPSLARIDGVADKPGRYGRDHDRALYGKK